MSRTHRSQEHTTTAAVQRARRPQTVAAPLPVEDARPQTARRPRDKSVRIGRTPVGKGIFARKRYPTTAIIGEILGEVIDDPDYESRYCMDIGGGRTLEPDPPFCYVNHSCEPNCEFDWFDLTPPGSEQIYRHVFLIALCEIKPGDELTIDYNWAADVAIPCRCGAASCIGWIVDRRQLASILAQHAKPPAAE